MDLRVHDPKKGEILKNGEIWGNFGGCGATTIRGGGQIVMEGWRANEDVLCKRWRFHLFVE